MSTSRTALVAELGVATRDKHLNPERFARAVEAFHAYKVEEAVTKYPSLAFEDRQRLAALILDGGAGE